MAVGQLQLLVVGVILGLAARGATSPTAQQMTDEEEKELLANLMLDLDGTQCPLSHPYAFKWGDKCCMFPREKEPPVGLPQFWNSVSEFCTGLKIRLSSRCCQDDAFIDCPKAPCASSSIVVTTTTTPRVVDPDDFEIISVRPPIKSAVAFLPVTSKPTTTTRRTSTTRRTTFDENGQDFEIISIPLISSGTPPPPKQRNPPPAAPAIDRSPSQRVTAEIEPNNDASRVVFPED